MTKQIIPIETIQQKIYFIRGEKVMFDRDLAALYGVELRTLNQAVKRNKKRFPKDFMFQLNNREVDIWKSYLIDSEANLKSQIVTSSYDIKYSRSQTVILKRGQNIKYLPYVFTEQGVAMLSSVLNSERAIQVNIQIMRIFTSLRKMLMTHKELKDKIEKMEKKYDKKFAIVFETIKLLFKEEEKPKEPLGFRCD